jgi:hypothetical protein
MPDIIEVESERDTLLARLAAVKAERDKLRAFVEHVRGMPGVCTCEYMSEAVRRVWGTCLYCRACAALAAPADAGEETPLQLNQRLTGQHGRSTYTK